MAGTDPMQAAPMNAMDPADPVTAMGEAAVPATDYCAAVANWDPAWVAFEDEVLVHTNEWRAKGGGICNGAPGLSPLKTQPMLRCSARLHSKDMGENNYFAHNSLDGRSPFDRMKNAGYVGFTMGENIAKGQPTPQSVVDAWMNSSGHCVNIMNGSYTEMGVGYFTAPGANAFIPNMVWTQNFGASGGGGASCPWGPPWC
jgi:uncharacterized protein YkwD